MKCRVLQADGSYTRLDPGVGEPRLCMQDAQMDIAQGREIDISLPSLTSAVGSGIGSRTHAAR